MQVRKTISLVIEDSTWAEFKMRSVAEDRPIGEIVLEWIEGYLQEEEDGSGNTYKYLYQRDKDSSTGI